MRQGEFSEPFAVRDAVRGGATRSRVRANGLVRPFRGMRIPIAVDGFDARCRAFLLHHPGRFAFSHTTAAFLHGIPLPAGVDDSTIHVSVPDPERAPAVRGFAGHSLARWETTVIDGLPVTTVPQTWLDLAAMLDLPAVVAAGDSAVSGTAPLTTIDELRAAVDASRGRRGIAVARDALARVRTGVESPAESLLRVQLTLRGLPEPEINRELWTPDGRFVARVDLAYPHARVALEYEGDHHRVDRRTWYTDIRRREAVEDLGWRMVRITAADLRAPAPLTARIRHLLLTRTPR